MNNTITNDSHHQTTIIRAAGLTYIIIIVIGVLNSIFIDARLIIYEDLSLTINNIGGDFLISDS